MLVVARRHPWLHVEGDYVGKAGRWRNRVTSPRSGAVRPAELGWRENKCGCQPASRNESVDNERA